MSEAPPEAAAAAPATAFTRAGVVEGARAMVPIALFVVPLGIAFGVAASQKGLSALLAGLMSLLVCGGASQFAALDLWVAPLPVLPILLTVLAVNARHLLYGAAIYPWLRRLTPLQRWPMLWVMTDTNWAYAMQAAAAGQRDAGILLGSGLLLWLTWTLSSAIGASLGGGIGNPKSFGLDAVMVGFFAASLVGLWRGAGDLRPWLAAALAAAAGLWLLPPGWHVLSGALAGGIVGVLGDHV